MSLLQELQDRSQSKYELCSATNNLNIYEVPPVSTGKLITEIMSEKNTSISLEKFSPDRKYQDFLLYFKGRCTTFLVSKKGSLKYADKSNCFAFGKVDNSELKSPPFK